jgi:hypothetical protein
LAHRDILRRDATSVAAGGIAEVVEQPPFERTTLVTQIGQTASCFAVMHNAAVVC